MADIAPCPRCRRLERMLLVTAAYLSPRNWHESAEILTILDRVKTHLPWRLQAILNGKLAKED